MNKLVYLDTEYRIYINSKFYLQNQYRYDNGITLR